MSGGGSEWLPRGGSGHYDYSNLVNHANNLSPDFKRRRERHQEDADRRGYKGVALLGLLMGAGALLPALGGGAAGGAAGGAGAGGGTAGGAAGGAGSAGASGMSAYGPYAAGYQFPAAGGTTGGVGAGSGAGATGWSDPNTYMRLAGNMSQQQGAQGPTPAQVAETQRQERARRQREEQRSRQLSEFMRVEQLAQAMNRRNV